jgi:hypothetical protein
VYLRVQLEFGSTGVRHRLAGVLSPVQLVSGTSWPILIGTIRTRGFQPLAVSTRRSSALAKNPSTNPDQKAGTRYVLPTNGLQRFNWCLAPVGGRF